MNKTVVWLWYLYSKQSGSGINKCHTKIIPVWKHVLNKCPPD